MSKKKEPEPTRPPRKCNVVVIKKAKDEGRDILTDIQYEHIKEVEMRLEDFFNRPEINDLKIEQIGKDLYELKEKGGPLGKINLRIYFGAISERDEVVVLKTYKKEEDHQVPPYILENVEDRFENYKAGIGVEGASVHVPERR